MSRPTCILTKAGIFLDFNVGYAKSHAAHWTQEYDKEEGLHKD